ncbi:hypothetical protein DPMN_023438 [Dreissena polymorpha]|uniref:Uncharacterized protein n=1 Tax=Dreissena polymorpha TaxID=45954 RepID=A0A9D4RBE1_DREPO|nr:hypothetical protein DPMN_023438 [Dreissena polymorpha]
MMMMIVVMMVIMMMMILKKLQLYGRWKLVEKRFEKFSCGKKALRLHAEGPYHIKNIRTIKTNQNRYRHPLNVSNPGASGGLWPPCPLDPPRALRPPGPQL